MYYIYKEKYKKEINSLDTNNKEWLDYKNLRLSEYLYSSEEEQEQKEQKPIKVDYKTFNKQIIDEETNILIYLTNILNFKSLVICSYF